jgi:hypothetical protein
LHNFVTLLAFTDDAQTLPASMPGMELHARNLGVGEDRGGKGSGLRYETCIGIAPQGRERSI